MSGRSPIGRDSAILLVSVLVGLAVMVLVPPSNAPTGAAVNAQGGGLGGSSPAPGTTAPSNGHAETPSSTTRSTSRRAGPTTAVTSTESARTATSSRTVTTARKHSKVKLMNSKYAPYAFLISGKTLSAKAKRALDGFERNRTRINATAVRITLVPYQPRYKRYSVLVRKGQKLYFLETSLGDDAPKRETQLGDDAPVKVNKDGYVIY